jgi:hypothetical protein
MVFSTCTLILFNGAPATPAVLVSIAAVLLAVALYSWK